jgi:hypothetical protein
VTLESVGIPSVSVITEPFAFKARAEVKALGYPALPIQILPHPIGQISDEEMHALTDEAYDEVEFALTQAADEVAAAYDGAFKARSTFSR